MAGAAILEWLLEGDPSIRWQALRDLKGAADRTWARERRRVARERWGARLLAVQNADGVWASGIYTPKWTSTAYTVVLLRSLGLPARHKGATKACRVLLDTGFWSDGGINIDPRWTKHGETCISSMVLAVLCWFRFDDPRVDRLAEHVMAQQMARHQRFGRRVAVCGGFHRICYGGQGRGARLALHQHRHYQQLRKISIDHHDPGKKLRLSTEAIHQRSPIQRPVASN